MGRNTKDTGKKMKGTVRAGALTEPSAPYDPDKVHRAKPLRLKVGKTYSTRDGRGIVKILCNTRISWPYEGEWIISPNGGWCECSFTAEGRWAILSGIEHRWDLVSEVPAPERPARKASRKRIYAESPDAKRSRK